MRFKNLLNSLKVIMSFSEEAAVTGREKYGERLIIISDSSDLHSLTAVSVFIIGWKNKRQEI